MLQGWQIKNITANRPKTEYKQMKDRDMTNVEVVFAVFKTDKNKNVYFFKEINQPSNKITIQYIANLCQTSIRKVWTYHGGGGWLQNLSVEDEKFNKMKNEVERLGGKVKVI